MKKLPRPYKVPGGNVVAWIIGIVCEIFIAQAIIFFIWVPGQEIDWSYAGPVLIGIVITLIVGEVLLLVAKKEKESAKS